MLPSPLPHLSAGGQALALTPEKFGELRRSNDLIGNPAGLKARMAEDGYLLIKGFFDRESVRAIRLEVAGKLDAEGLLDSDHAVEDLVAKSGLHMYFRPDISNASESMQSLIYGQKMMAFYSELLGGEAMHYDFTWLRVVAPGKGTHPHCDIVYMGRGTHNLFTAWVPFGDVPLSIGGLIILENSHKNADLQANYCQQDVDEVCENIPGKKKIEAAGFHEWGVVDLDFLRLQEKLGGRWLTAEYEMGDLLTFSMYTVHGSLDNASNQIRVSSDSRYQLASEPFDERWVGESPVGHGEGAKKSLIC